MPRVPDDFKEEFEERGETFFEIAELLFSSPDREYTQDELSDRVDRSNTTVSNHTQDMVDSEWLIRRENQTTFSWNTDVYDPSSTEGIYAVKRFYADFWALLSKHSNTVPGAFAIAGFIFILAAVVVFTFYLGFSLGITQASSLPAIVYLAIALGSFITGVIITSLSPIQAKVNRFVWRHLPDRWFQND